MKFALVNIPDHGISGKGYSAPLGLAYIGAVVKSLGYEVKAYDLGANKRLLKNYYLQADKLFLDSLAAYQPDFIGMSCSTTNRLNLNFWAGVFKKLLPNVKIIVGGPHPYFIPEIFLKTAVDVDILVMGEGELTIADYLKAVSAGDELDAVKGIAFRNKMGDVIVNPPREVISNLDEILFPARDLFPINDYDIDFGTIVGKTATMITSRGCGNHCKFCSTTRYWKKVRFRSAKNIVDEIENVMENFPSIKNFVFFDDTFTGRRDHALSVCDEILERKIKINWGC
jgi:anaerobic magnesium-protoporphyrin IX monomethyl ester cyclase